MQYTQKDLDRFWSKIDKSGDCWTWTPKPSPYGYGRIMIGGRKGKYVMAHRFSYETTFGPVAAGMDLDHQCRNRLCVRPDHLRPTTRKENNENRGVVNKNNKSTGVRGVTKHGSGFVGQVTHNWQYHYCGKFSTIAEAEAAVIAKRNELFTHNDLDRLAA